MSIILYPYICVHFSIIPLYSFFSNLHKKKKKREREKEKIRTLEKEDASNGENVTNNIKSGLVCEG
jgi:hypothetical protein